MIATTPNEMLMAQARQSLAGRWALAVGAVLVFMVATMGVQVIPGIGVVLGLVLTGPLSVGLARFSLSLARGQAADVQQLFTGFQNTPNAIAAYFLMLIFILLWSLLLIVPGIIAATSYAMTYYILAEDETITAMDALKKSTAMMQGNKWKFCCLSGRFIGWILLCVLTCGIGYLWLAPYMTVSYAKFYEDIKESDNIAAYAFNTNPL